MPTTVEALADGFKEAGTPFIVGHPGGESVELMEAARQRDRFLLMKQEVAGAMLAATWGEITGAPGVCLSTRGPGAANMVNGIAHAALDRAPLIAITDRYSTPECRSRSGACRTGRHDTCRCPHRRIGLCRSAQCPARAVTRPGQGDRPRSR